MISKLEILVTLISLIVGILISSFFDIGGQTDISVTIGAIWGAIGLSVALYVRILINNLF